MVILIAFAVSLAAEVFCLSFAALLVFMVGTDRISGYRKETVTENINAILDFIWSGKDKKLRIISVNQGLHNYMGRVETLSKYIKEVQSSKGYEGLKQITYSDLRNKCYCPKLANLFPDVYEEISEVWKEVKRDACTDHNCGEKFINICTFIAFAALLFWFIPVLFLSKLLQIAYPWIIVGYLGYYQLLFAGEIHLFQMVMLMVYIGLQLMVLFLGIHVGRIQWYLWHCEPGGSAYWHGSNANKLSQAINEWYESVCWYPIVRKIVLQAMGNDIGPIVMDYCKSFQLSDSLLA